MLSGSRIIIIHYFEALCDILAAISSAPTSHFLPKLTRMARRSPFVQTSSNMPSTSTNSTSRRVLTAGDHREICRRVRRERDKTVFEHTLDIQLGAPQASGSIYLAYENGRVGVVTVRFLENTSSGMCTHHFTLRLTDQRCLYRRSGPSPRSVLISGFAWSGTDPQRARRAPALLLPPVVPCWGQLPHDVRHRSVP